MSNASTNVGGILLLYHHSLSANAPTIMEYVRAFERHSRFRVWKVNTELGFPQTLSGLRFQAIVLHYSVFASWPYALSDLFLNYLDESRESYKAAIFQDEYHFCQQRFDFLNRYHIDFVSTLIEPAYFKDFYLKFTNVPVLVNHLTGYVGEEMVETAHRLTRPGAERTIDIGYRARPLPYYMGRGAQEKTEIAREFRARARGLGLKLDIETDEDKRIYSHRWYEFVANCRGMIGTEAGVSITDIDGSVRQECERLLALRPEMTFSEMEEALLYRFENTIPMRTISPRHFEAAAFRVCQILYEGRYNGILEPGRHYIPLKKDFSNFDDCIRMFQDRGLRREMTERAYDELIASGQYSYRKFIEDFDRELLRAGLQPEVSAEEATRITARLESDRRRLQLRARKNELLYHRNFPGRRAMALVGGPLLRALRKLRQMLPARGQTA